MVIRIVIALFASSVAALSFLTGLGRLMSALLIGFGALCSFFLAVLLVLPEDTKSLLIPVYTSMAAWPFVIIGVLLSLMIPALYLLKIKKKKAEQVSSLHFKYLLGGIGGYLISLFLSSVYWFPADAKISSTDPSSLKIEMMVGTVLYLLGVCISCYFFYLSSRGGSERHPDLMRRFVLGFFTFCHFDKMPLLVTYLLIYSPESQTIFPNIAAFALTSYIPVGLFLLKTSLDADEK